MRYRLHEHPAYPGLLSKEDLFMLVERGSLARGDVCTDMVTHRDHTVGDVIRDMLPARARTAARVGRPLYREFRADDPYMPEPKMPEEMPNSVAPEAIEEGEEPEALLDGEEILHHSHPSWLGAGKPLFLAVLLLITTGMLLKIDLVYALMSGSCAGLLLLGIVVARTTRHYYVTDERVELVWGLLGRSTREVRICDIRSIDVHEGGLKGLLGLGTVDFSSAANAGTEVQFRDIRKAHEVKELVRQLQRTARE